MTAVVGAEVLINSRPLFCQSSDPADLTPLTPKPFLHGQLGGKFVPDSVDSEAFNPRKRWCRVPGTCTSFLAQMVARGDPQSECKEKVAQGPS